MEILQFYANYARNRVVLQKNLHSWHKFYKNAGRDGRDKSQLCSLCSLCSVFFGQDVQDMYILDNHRSGGYIWNAILKTAFTSSPFFINYHLYHHCHHYHALVGQGWAGIPVCLINSWGFPTPVRLGWAHHYGDYHHFIILSLSLLWLREIKDLLPSGWMQAKKPSSP